jgi:hypothetical protein
MLVLLGLRQVNVALLRSPKLGCHASDTGAAVGIARTLRQWWSDRQEADAYLTLNPQERASLARDVGVSSQMLASLVSRGQQASRELPQGPPCGRT